MRLFVHELRWEQLIFWRNREAAIFTFFLPVILFLIFGAIYGNHRLTKEGGIRAASFLEAGMIGYGVAATCFAGLGITLVIRRESGILKRIRSTPLPAPTYIFAVLGSTFLVFLIEAALIIACGRHLLLGRRDGEPRSPCSRCSRSAPCASRRWGSGSRASSARPKAARP